MPLAAIHRFLHVSRVAASLGEASDNVSSGSGIPTLSEHHLHDSHLSTVKVDLNTHLVTACGQCLVNSIHDLRWIFEGASLCNRYIVVPAKPQKPLPQTPAEKTGHLINNLMSQSATMRLKGV